MQFSPSSCCFPFLIFVLLRHTKRPEANDRSPATRTTLHGTLHLALIPLTAVRGISASSGCHDNRGRRVARMMTPSVSVILVWSSF